MGNGAGRLHGSAETDQPDSLADLIFRLDEPREGASVPAESERAPTVAILEADKETTEEKRNRIMSEMREALPTPDESWTASFVSARTVAALVWAQERLASELTSVSRREVGDSLVEAANESMGRPRLAPAVSMGHPDAEKFARRYKAAYDRKVDAYAQEYLPVLIMYEWGEMFNQFHQMRSGDLSAFTIVTRSGGLNKGANVSSSVDVGVSDAFNFLTPEQQEDMKSMELENMQERLRLLALTTLEMKYEQAVTMLGALGLLGDRDVLASLLVVARGDGGKGIASYLRSLPGNPVVRFPVGESGPLMAVNTRTGEVTKKARPV